MNSENEVNNVNSSEIKNDDKGSTKEKKSKAKIIIPIKMKIISTTMMKL